MKKFCKYTTTDMEIKAGHSDYNEICNQEWHKNEMANYIYSIGFDYCPSGFYIVSMQPQSFDHNEIVENYMKLENGPNSFNDYSLKLSYKPVLERGWPGIYVGLTLKDLKLLHDRIGVFISNTE